MTSHELAVFVGCFLCFFTGVFVGHNLDHKPRKRWTIGLGHWEEVQESWLEYFKSKDT